MNTSTVAENSNLYTIDLNVFEDFLRDFIEENFLESYDTLEEKEEIKVLDISLFFPLLKEIIDGLTEDLVINSDHYITPNNKADIKRIINNYLSSQLPYNY